MFKLYYGNYFNYVFAAVSWLTVKTIVISRSYKDKIDENRYIIIYILGNVLPFINFQVNVVAFGKTAP